MKRFLQVILILIYSACLIFAADNPQPGHRTDFGFVYALPRSGAAGIPMNPYRDASGNGSYTPIVGDFNKKGPYVGTSSKGVVLDKGTYTQDELIVLGGITSMNPEYKQKAEITVTASCPNGFFFVSQSNPSYVRPFELYIIPKGQKTLVLEGYGQAEVLSNQNSVITFSYADMPDIALANPELWFDMVLVLPGTVEHDVLTMPDGKAYPLTEAYDYSAVVSVTVQAQSQHENRNGWGTLVSYGPVIKSDPITITIPFSGYYESTAGNKMTSAISMSVHPSAKAGNLDLKNYDKKGQEVATVQIQSVYEVDKEMKGSSFAVFLSSSSESKQEGETFKLVKEGLKYGTPKTVYNSIEYEVILVSEEYGTGTTTPQTYTGTDHIIGTNQIPSTCVYPSSTFYTEDRRSDLTGKDTMGYDYIGTVYVRIKDPHGIVLEAGRYTSDIYVHVVEL